MEDIIVSKHKAVRNVLIERGVVEPDTPWVPYAVPEVISGKRVFGVLPLHLAQHAEEVVDIHLVLPREKKYVEELTEDDVREYMRDEGHIFKVTRENSFDLRGAE